MLSVDSVKNIQRVMQSSLYSALKPDFTEIKPPELQISSIKTSDKSEYSKNVYFRDPLTHSYVSVGLSDENLQNLENIFGKDSLKRDENKNILLKNEAEKFVSGWFGDIAYKRGYLKADINQDGSLSDEEKIQLTAFHGFTGIVSGDIIQPLFTTYAKSNEVVGGAEEAYIFDSSIESALNATLELDKNADGKVTFGEKMTTKYVQQFIYDYIAKNKEDKKGTYTIPPFAPLAMMEEIAKMLKKLLQKQLATAGIKLSEKTIESTPLETLRSMLDRVKDNPSTEQQIQSPEDSNPQTNTFSQIQSLTKIPKEILEHNLNYNPNFEEEVISIVREITENVDKAYQNTQQKARLNIQA